MIEREVKRIMATHVASRSIRIAGVTEQQLDEIARILGIPIAGIRQVIGDQGDTEVKITRNPPRDPGTATP
jgi:hypothetical protein